MRVSTLSTMNCPRCAAPVRGDYKYCPECACRLRAAPRTTEPEAPSRAPVLVVATGILLVAAGILVGWKIVADQGRRTQVVYVEPPRKTLRVADIHHSLVPIPEGTAWYDRNENVLVAPPGALDRLVRRIPASERDSFLAALSDDPEHLGRWGKLLSFFYERSEDVIETRTREEPVSVLPFRCMRYEVTRGQYKEFLAAVEADPSILVRHAWVKELWWPEPGSDPDPDVQRYRVEQARHVAWRYREEWWSRVAQHHQEKHGLAEPPPRPAWLGPVTHEDSTEAFQRLTAAEAIRLLIPPHWIRLDPDGIPHWADDELDENLPVTDICWYDAHMFVIWAQRETGINTLRLPTWGEWTRAFHGGRAAREPDDFNERREPGRDWPWGNTVDPHGCNNLTFVDNEDEPVLRDVREAYSWHGGRTVEGLMNMAGNAAEWTDNIATRYQANQEGRLYVVWDRDDESAAERAFACGGSFLDGLDDCKVSARRALFKTARQIGLGFRLVTAGSL